MVSDHLSTKAKDGEGRNAIRWERPSRGKRRTDKENRDQSVISNTTSSKESSRFNTAVVSEVNGYTFGVWGLSGDEDGTTRHHRDHNLLAVVSSLHRKTTNAKYRLKCGRSRMRHYYWGRLRVNTQLKPSCDLFL